MPTQQKTSLESMAEHFRVVEGRKIKTILLAPKRLFDSEIYFRAIERYKDVFQLRSVARMFGSNSEWRSQFPAYLKPYELAIIAYDGGFVGRGVYDELYWLITNHVPVYIFDGDRELLLKQCILADSEDWTNYATLLTEELK